MCVASRCEAAGGGGGVRQGSGLRQPRDRARGLGFSWRPRDKDYREIFGGGGLSQESLVGEWGKERKGTSKGLSRQVLLCTAGNPGRPSVYVPAPHLSWVEATSGGVSSLILPVHLMHGLSSPLDRVTGACGKQPW